MCQGDSPHARGTRAWRRDGRPPAAVGEAKDEVRVDVLPEARGSVGHVVADRLLHLLVQLLALQTLGASHVDRAQHCRRCTGARMNRRRRAAGRAERGAHRRRSKANSSNSVTDRASVGGTEYMLSADIRLESSGRSVWMRLDAAFWTCGCRGASASRARDRHVRALHAVHRRRAPLTRQRVGTVAATTLLHCDTLDSSRHRLAPSLAVSSRIPRSILKPLL